MQTTSNATTSPPPVESALPQDTGQVADVVVMAQRTEQRLQDVPISVTALSSSDLKRTLAWNAIGLAVYFAYGRARAVAGG